MATSLYSSVLFLLFFHRPLYEFRKNKSILFLIGFFVVFIINGYGRKVYINISNNIKVV